MKKAFRGPNGWYVADEGNDGTHYQPDNGGTYQTKAAALAAEDAEDGHWVDVDGTEYDANGNVVAKH